MAKSTQDLCMWLKDVGFELALQGHRENIPLVGIEVFSDKSYRVTAYIGTISEEIYNSDNEEEAGDINDLVYREPKDFVQEALQILSVKNVKAEDL